MIEERLLKQLGWSDELISEVNRIGNNINEISEKITNIEVSVSTHESVSGDTIFYESKEIEAGSYVPLEYIKKTNSLR